MKSKTPTKKAPKAKEVRAPSPKKPKTPAKKAPKEKEVHVHIHPQKRPPPQPMNVTRVVHHSSKGDKEIVYRSPAKVGKDGRIGKGEKKVVHIHHHKNETKEQRR
jgi:hypothetical protein